MRLLRGTGASVFLTLAFAIMITGAAYADPLPIGWSCIGGCGSAPANGVVPLSPNGTALYQWVSTTGGITGAGQLPAGVVTGEGVPTNGSSLSTSVFTVTSPTTLNFYFDYVTSDGQDYPDYAWAQLFNATTNTPDALLFTARTMPAGSIVPGAGMPNPAATLTPSSVPIIPNQTTWSMLGGSSGTCWKVGCGNTGWINSSYLITTPGDYYLMIGVVNYNDQQYDSGLAMDGVTVGGVPIDDDPAVPEPATVLLLGSGIIPVLWRRYMKK